MKKVKEKTEDLPDWIKLIFKWVFLLAGVPSLSYVFLWASVQSAFEAATTGWQIFLGFSLFSIFLGYIYFSIKYLVEETIGYFK